MRHSNALDNRARRKTTARNLRAAVLIARNLSWLTERAPLTTNEEIHGFPANNLSHVCIKVVALVARRAIIGRR